MMMLDSNYSTSYMHKMAKLLTEKNYSIPWSILASIQQSLPVTWAIYKMQINPERLLHLYSSYLFFTFYSFYNFSQSPGHYSLLTKLPTVITDHVVPFLLIASHYYNWGKVPWIIPSVLLLESIDEEWSCAGELYILPIIIVSAR